MNTATLERAADADFVLVTEWHIAAHIDAVWEALNHPDYWPRWWPYVRAVEKLRGGDAEGVGSLYRLEWTSKLPYEFTFEVETVEVARYERIRAWRAASSTARVCGNSFPKKAPRGCGTRGASVSSTPGCDVSSRWQRRSSAGITTQ